MIDMPTPAPKKNWRHVLLFSWVTSTAFVVWLLKVSLGTVWGVLGVSLCLYWLAPAIFGIQPLGAGELVDWFNGLTENAQVAVGAAMLTAIGLVAAYLTAMAVWKKQKFIEIRISAASDMRTRFNAAQRIVIDLSSYLSILVEAAEEARLAKPKNDARYALAYVNSEAVRFQDRTKALHEARMELNGIFTDHGIIIVGIWEGWEKLARYIAMIDEAWEACSFLPPSADYAASDFVEVFLRRYDKERVLHALRACERVTTSASAVAGQIHGRLISGAIPITLGALRSLVLHRNWMLAGAAYASDAARNVEPPATRTTGAMVSGDVKASVSPQ